MPKTVPRAAGPACRLSIILPTYNRVGSLLVCLDHLEAQSVKCFEVLVVDDGSTDDTPQRVAEFAHTASFPLRYLSQVNAGPARARNVAISEAASPICLFIGDDIFPARDLVEIHLQFHAERPEVEAAALGYTRWCEGRQKVTPLMRWLDAEGIQFGYRELLAGASPTWRNFYTSNLSVKTALLGDTPFHEGFPDAGMEDIELGYRLYRQRGLKMYFLRDAVAEHLHPTTLADSCRRAVKIGSAEYHFEKLWPEQRPPGVHPFKRAVLFLFSEPKLLLLPALTAAARLVTRFGWPERLVRRVLQFHRILGYRRAARAGH